MESNNSISFTGVGSSHLVPEFLVQNGEMFLFILALLLFAFSLFVFYFHLTRFSVNKLRSLRAELFYIIGSVILFLIMAILLSFL